MIHTDNVTIVGIVSNCSQFRLDKINNRMMLNTSVKHNVLVPALWCIVQRAAADQSAALCWSDKNALSPRNVRPCSWAGQVLRAYAAYPWTSLQPASMSNSTASPSPSDQATDTHKWLILKNKAATEPHLPCNVTYHQHRRTLRPAKQAVNLLTCAKGIDGWVVYGIGCWLYIVSNKKQPVALFIILFQTDNFWNSFPPHRFERQSARKLLLNFPPHLKSVAILSNKYPKVKNFVHNCVSVYSVNVSISWLTIHPIMTEMHCSEIANLA